MYVGKNNYQNDELTFRIASGSDWWFHAKGAPGSHVIVKAKGEELPDFHLEEAARLAAHYSKNRNPERVGDRLRRKEACEKAKWRKAWFRRLLYKLFDDDRL